MVELHQLASALLPGVLGLVAGAAAVKFYCYSQLEVITAKMLSKYVPSGGGGGAAAGARVIQLGGGTRELYYYPKDVVLVVNVGETVNKGLMEQAGVTAAVPTLVKQQPVTDLRFQPDASIDAVVALDTLAGLDPQQQQQCLREVARVLKPGTPLVFVEPLAEGGSPLRGLVGVSSGKTLTTAQLEAWQQLRGFSYVQWDTALGGQDPHAVGVAVRSEAAEDDEGPPSARQQRRRKQPKAAKGFS